MGHLQASEMANSGLDRRVAIEWHLTYNHFPPIPLTMADAALQAIENARTGDWDLGIDIGGRRVSTAWLVETLHLEAFIEREDDAEWGRD